MAAWSIALALCVAACSAGASAGEAGAGEDAARWQNIVADYTRNAASAAGGSAAVAAGSSSAGAWGGWFPPPIPLQLPLHSEGGRSLPVLVVPVPVPVPFAAPADAAQCPVSPQPIRTVSYDSYSAPAPAPVNAAPDAQVVYGPAPVYNQPQPQYAPATSAPYAPSAPPAPPAPPIYVPEPDNEVPPAPAPTRGPSRRVKTDERHARNAPKFPPVEDSRLLVEQFLAQEPKDPSLPPIVIDPVGVVSTEDYTVEELEASQISSHQKAMGPEVPHVEELTEALADPQASAERKRLICRRRKTESGESEAQGAPPPPPPPPPRFERSMLLRGRLTVPRADYTEPYTIWWDAASGASRVDFHGGSTSTYRMMKRDGRVQSVQIRVDRTGETDVRRCTVTSPRRMTLAERALPALPDLQAFTFAGYVLRGEQRTERWRYTMSGHSGELGGARGEALTFLHELLVRRAPDNFTTIPLRYAVRVDSSVLGADCDTYVHHFDEVQTKHHNSAMFNLNVADACEHVEITDRMDIVEPLREFTMMRRDPRHDVEIEQYKKKFERVYADDVEEAVRKNILMQNQRFTAAANRQGASFDLGINFLSDRLVAERRVMLGVEQVPDSEPGEPFPHPRAELEALRGRLPRKFDWRERGAVTPVRSKSQARLTLTYTDSTDHSFKIP
ncbi:unnamed protein product [Chrysodeixis includens]|uniref:Cathepsin propeptide inhibitor domain-containing protein n=1 Tax=Chrysodeixis includens TaxID=689277 RepID=A0A9P0FV11_CHRIL|nr:unnamed protein product [Chrysodeixis includens]